MPPKLDYRTLTWLHDWLVNHSEEHYDWTISDIVVWLDELADAVSERSE